MAETKRDKSNDQYRKIFVGGLGANTTDASLRAHFENFGGVVDVVVMKDPNTGKHRGFGFVTFDSQESVDNAQKARPHEIDGKTAETKRAIPKEDTAPENRYVSKQLFVGGLRREITKEQIEEYFTNFGQVNEVVIIRDKATQQPRGFGFVTFEDPDSVDKVIINKPHTIANSRADVKKSISKEEMQALQAKQGYQNGPPMGGQRNPGWGPPPPETDNTIAGAYYGAPQQYQGGYGYGAPQPYVNQGGWGDSSYYGGVAAYPQQGGYAPQAPAPQRGGRGGGGPMRGGRGGGAPRGGGNPGANGRPTPY